MMRYLSFRVYQPPVDRIDGTTSYSQSKILNNGVTDFDTEKKGNSVFDFLLVEYFCKCDTV